MKIQITNIESAIITNLEYDDKSRDMIIEYMNSVSYVYHDVEQSIIDAFIVAESKGKYINSIKSNYVNEKIENDKS